MARHPISNRTFLLLAAYFLMVGVPFAYLGISRMFSEWVWLNDMHFFYDAAQVITSSHRDLLYDPAARFAAGFGSSESDQVFPYPVIVAYLFWPLTLTDIVTARYLFVGFSVIAVALIAVAGFVWSRDLRLAVLIVLMAASSFTLYETMRFQQLAPVLALMVCISVLSAVSPKSIRGGIITGLLVLKPSIAVVPLTLITLRRGYVQIAAAAITGALVLILIPLAVVGVDGMKDYMNLLSRFRDESFLLQGKLTAGAGWMLGWQAIAGRLAMGDPDLLVVMALNVLTLAVMARVWLRGRYFDSWLAATLTTLLIVPHVIWYDWLILLGVAPFAIYTNRSLPLLGLLLALHAAVSFDCYLIVTRPMFDAYPLPTPLLAGAILLYLAFAPRSAAAAEVVESHEPADVALVPAT